jgi:hypothetical protein
MSGTTAVILTLVGAVVLCGVVVWFVLRRTKRDTYRGTVADKTVSERTDGDGGTYNVHLLVVALDEGGRRNITVGKKVLEQFAVGDRIVKEAGTNSPAKG